MNNKKSISLTICWILAVVLGLPALSFANNESVINPEAKQRFEKAIELRKAADYDAAITEYKNVINLCPNSEIAQNAQYWIGQSHFEAGQLDAALTAFQGLLDEYPESTIIPSAKTMIERVQQAKKNKSLFEAVEAGDLAEVTRLIAEGANVKAKAENDQSVLHCAIENSHKDIAEFLITQGADVNVLFKGGTPLFPAIFNDDLDIIQLLIDNGADCNINTPLIWAITALGEKDKEIVELLIRAGADINLEDDNGYTPLHSAVFSGSEEVLQVVLNTITDINTIHIAALKGDLAKVRVFVQKGIDVNSKDTSGCTPLHLAAINNNNEVVDFLLTNGADVNAKNNHGETPLLAARSLDMIKFLVSRGADVNAKPNTQGYTRLHNACQFDNDLEVASFLISNGANVNTANNWGVTPLIGASVNGNREIVKLLIDKGADVNTKNNSGQIPLHMVCQRGNKEIAELLIDKGADINSQNNNGLTPLHLAARSGQKDIVELLINKRSDLNIKNNAGRTPLRIAMNEGHTEIIKLLRKHGAKE